MELGCAAEIRFPGYDHGECKQFLSEHGARSSEFVRFFAYTFCAGHVEHVCVLHVFSPENLHILNEETAEETAGTAWRRTPPFYTRNLRTKRSHKWSGLTLYIVDIHIVDSTDLCFLTFI